MEMITQFMGRFHPLLVHLPIGFLLLAFIFECLSLFEKYHKLKIAVQPALLFGAAFAIVSCITGYFLKQEGGYDPSLVDLHQNFGIATAIFAVLVFVIRKKLKRIILNPQRRKQVRAFLFVPLIALLAATGHLGGSLTHGESFLSLGELTSSSSPVDPGAKISAIVNIDTAILYRDVIQPLLEARCYSCHSATKQKGKLRLDHPDFILKGGDSGEVLVPGIPDSSMLYTCLMLPIEDKHHMPPEEKEQMSSTDIALLQAWIKKGASFDKKISALENPDKIMAYVKSYQTNMVHSSWIPENEIGKADQALVDKLRSSGVLVIPISASSNYLMINFVNARNLVNPSLPSLMALKEHVVWMNLGFTAVTDEELKNISQLENIRMLYLNNTAISDTGISYIKSMKELRYLNVVGIAVTDKTLIALRDMSELNEIYIYQTKITSEGVRNFLKQSPGVKVDTGKYQLKPLPGDTVVYKRKI
jgi:uncharacterized membrane protein